MINILYIDEDKKYAAELVSFLNLSNFRTTYSHDVDDINNLIFVNEINIILVDYQKIEGNLKFIKEIVAHKIPLVILSKNTAADIEVHSLREGATDFIYKSSYFDAIKFRLINIYNSSSVRLLDIVVHGKKCKLDVITRVISNDDDIDITLNQKEFLIIYNLLSNKNKIVSYNELSNILSNKNDSEITEKYINVIIFRIRTKLKLYNLNSIRGRGYIWIDEI